MAANEPKPAFKQLVKLTQARTNAMIVYCQTYGIGMKQVHDDIVLEMPKRWSKKNKDKHAKEIGNILGVVLVDE